MQTTMDLSGLWEVRLGDGAPATVHLPGTLEENGLGEPETPALESRLTRRFRWEGEAVFSREVTLPDHPGRRLILEAERARQLGYRDPYYFSRAFKKVMGVSPRSYQNGLGRSDPPGDEET